LQSRASLSAKDGSEKFIRVAVFGAQGAEFEVEAPVMASQAVADDCVRVHPSKLLPCDWR
jgi:hypothetical protein